MTTGGAWQGWRPADLLSDDDLRAARHIHDDGAPFSVAIGAQPGKESPAPPDAMRTIIHGGITRHYVAEWESIVRELAPLEPDWAAAFPITDADLRDAGLRDEIARRDFACIGERLKPGSDSTLRDWTYKAFNRDAVVAENAGATLNVTSLFMPILDRDETRPAASGDYALEIVAPNLGKIRWEQVVEFREYAAVAKHARNSSSKSSARLTPHPPIVLTFNLPSGRRSRVTTCSPSRI